MRGFSELCASKEVKDIQDIRIGRFGASVGETSIPSKKKKKKKISNLL